MERPMAALPSDHPMMKAWNEWQREDEFKNTLRWSIATKYDDGRPIDDIQREQHVRGGLWLAFTKGMEHAAPQNEMLLFEIAAFLKITFKDKLLTASQAEVQARDLLDKIGEVLASK